MSKAYNLVPFIIGKGMVIEMFDEIKKKYPYLYETHLHTAEGSACARNTGREMARACKEYGYTGIFVTDHNWGGNTAVDRKLPWEEWVNTFCRGYESAKEEGDRIGLDVFFGYEAGFDATEFLVCGIDKQWMLANPSIRYADVREQYRLVHQNGGMVIHAHPYREADYIPEIRLFPECVDGVEGINAIHSKYSNYAFDEKAIAYAKQHHFPLTAGSDIHHTDLLGGGIAFKRKLTSVSDYIKAILSDEEYVLTDGVKWYNKEGKQLDS